MKTYCNLTRIKDAMMVYGHYAIFREQNMRKWCPNFFHNQRVDKHETSHICSTDI